jgi:hypothetical protein
MPTDLIIAKTILQQLGGSRFIAMTGSKNFVADENKLNMKLSRNIAKAQYLTITLNSMDTYDLKFTSVDKNFNLIIRAERKNVYCDELQQVFTQITGLNTHL